MDFSPLLSADRRMIDAVIKCDIDQVEKMIPVMVDVPTRVSPRQRTEIEVPQMAHFRFQERFRWPVERVLVVGLGMVAVPTPAGGTSLLPGVPLPLGNSPAGRSAGLRRVQGAGHPRRQRPATRAARCARPRTTAAATERL